MVLQFPLRLNANCACCPHHWVGLAARGPVLPVRVVRPRRVLLGFSAGRLLVSPLTREGRPGRDLLLPLVEFLARRPVIGAPPWNNSRQRLPRPSCAALIKL